MKRISQKSWILAGVSLCCCIGLSTSIFAQDIKPAAPLPEIGFVVSPTGVVVRDGYPRVKVNSGYQKARKTCSIGQGVSFQVIGTETIVNQEVWLKIQTIGDIESKSVDCGQSTAGWIVAQLSDGQKLVETMTISSQLFDQLREEDTPDQVQAKVVQEATQEGVNRTPPPPKDPIPDEMLEDKGTGALLVWWNYVAIALGSVVGFIFLDLERDRVQTIQAWLTLRNIIRISFLVGFNLVLLNVACSDFSLLSIGILETLPLLIRSFWGTLIAGIILSVVILKAIAFSWDDDD